MSSKIESITVAYWSIRGLAAPLRMMTMYAGLPLNNVMYDVKEKDGVFDRSEWSNKKKELIEQAPLINLPYVIVKDGKHDEKIVSQSNACYSYLGRSVGLWGSNDDEVSACEEFLCELMDIRNTAVRYMYSKDATPDTVTTFIDNVTSDTSSFMKLSRAHTKKCATDPSNACFLVGDHATAPDFVLYEMMYQHKALAKFHSKPDPFIKFPILNDFYDGFIKLENNQKYLNSNVGRESSLPINQKTAAGFGATPSGALWENNMAYCFNDYVGMM